MMNNKESNGNSSNLDDEDSKSPQEQLATLCTELNVDQASLLLTRLQGNDETALFSMLQGNLRTTPARVGVAKYQSGLTYNSKNHTILFNSVNIGVVAKEEWTWRLRAVPAYTNPELNAAWNSAIKNDVVDLEELKKIVTPTHDNFLALAVMTCNSNLLLGSMGGAMPVNVMGEMFFQTHIYAAFSQLLSSFEGLVPFQDHYASGQDVSSSLSSKLERTEQTTIEDCQITMQPGAAICILHKRDAYAMIQIKPKQNSLDYSYRRDYDKCTLMTASTALVLCACEMKHDDIALPFLVGKGFNVSLYVMCIDSSGQPVVKCVEIAPGTVSPVSASLENSGHRSKVFVALAFLISQFWKKVPQKIVSEIKGRYGGEAQGFTRAFSKRKTEDKPTPAKTPRRGGSSTAGDGRSERDSSSHRSEEKAEQAAACQGAFISVQRPWLRLYNFRDDSSSSDSSQYQDRSPFYFKGIHAASKQLAFLKVWREGDTHTSQEEIISELHMIKSAQDSGIPVANLITPEIMESQVGGTKYFMMATQHVEQDTRNMAPEDIVPFAVSLVSAVDELHCKTGILHCDLKPQNLRWDDATKSIKLVDFGHAQFEDGARSYRSTEGFEAPEILQRHPHSRITDAYAVGRTLLEVLAHSGETLPAYGVVEGVAEKLVVDTQSDRWSLTEALTALVKEQTLTGNSPITDEEPTDEGFTPPRKMAKTIERIERQEPDYSPIAGKAIISMSSMSH